MPAPIQSLQRAIRILYAIAGREEGCTVQEIAQQAVLKPITTYKILCTLEAEKFIVRRPGFPLRFTLGHAVHELKCLDDSRTLLTEAGKELLKAQRRMPQAHFGLIQDEGGDSFARMIVFPEHYGKLCKMREFRQHSYEKVSSLLFLAYSSPAEAALFYQKHPYETEGAPYWGRRENFEAFLDKVRRLGYSQTDKPPTDRVFTHRIAAPVFSSDGRVVAAVGAYLCDADVTSESLKLMARLARLVAETLTRKLSGVVSLAKIRKR